MQILEKYYKKNKMLKFKKIGINAIYKIYKQISLYKRILKMRVNFSILMIKIIINQNNNMLKTIMIFKINNNYN